MDAPPSVKTVTLPQGERLQRSTLVANTILDNQGQISQWNARAQRLFGFDNNAVVGRYYSCLFDDAVPPDEAAHLLAAAARAGYADYVADCRRALRGRFPAQLLLTALVR
ncbi:MAG TPA: PAS domain-containing protein, partial [Burkholderiales bacterium]|nr:PAS domain-containing protein [Burkholderiales bacterium]